MTGPSERRLSRERALGILYEAEMKSVSRTEVLAELSYRPENYVEELVRGVEDHEGEIDVLLERHANDWALGRMPAIDLALLRIASFELLCTAVPLAVVIDEAIELAKQYSTEESAGFVNGVLSSVARDIEEMRSRP